MVTVACPASSSSAAGLPTTVDRPTTTARRPLSGTRSWRRMASTAAAVAGAKTPGSPAASPPSEAGLAPSTSLATGIAVPTPGRPTPGGSGAWQTTPCTAGSAESSARRWVICPALGGGPGGPPVRWTWQAMPARVAARWMDRTYQAAPASSVGTSTARVGVIPPLLSTAAAAAVAVAIVTAIVLPSTRWVTLVSRSG